jgi:transcriptional regulator with XRE-family HTH domain
MANPCVLKADVARARLLSLGTTQTALADRCGVDLRTLQRWFAGGRARLEDAERVAAALGVGTSEIWEGVPSLALQSLFAPIRALLRRTVKHEGSLGHALRLALAHFELFDRHVAFSAHPTQGFVHREAIASEERDQFAVLQVDTFGAESLRLSFGTQVGHSFRYEFGEVCVHKGRVILSEHFHTRSVRAELASDATFHVWVWAPSEMRELVVTADHDVRIRRAPVRGEHAVCFRPAAMHLRAARLSPVYDRIRGHRGDRVDVEAR